MKDEAHSANNNWIGLIAIGVLLSIPVSIGLFGIGQPYEYYYNIENVQVLDGPSEIDIFVDVHNHVRYPGQLRRRPVHKSVTLYRIIVTPDGDIEMYMIHKIDDSINFNANLFAIIRFQDGFYLVSDPASPARELLQLSGDRIEVKARPEYDAVLRSIGTTGFFDRTKLDNISEQNGWKRLNGDNSEGPFLLISDIIKSERNQVQFRLQKGQDSVSIIAESYSNLSPWSKNVITINTRRWRSHEAP